MNFHELLESEEFHDAVENKIPTYFKIEEPDIDWNDIFVMLDEDVKNKKPHGKKVYSGFAFRLWQVDRLPYLKEIMNHIYTYFDPYEIAECMLYASLTTEKGNFGGEHKDTEEVLFWQAHGKSEWIIFDDNGNTVFKKVLEKNDVVYCPGNMTHEVIPITPRLGFSLGFIERKK